MYGWGIAAGIADRPAGAKRTSVGGEKVDLDYHVRLLPQSDQAEVRLTLAKGEAVRSLDFDLGDGSHYSDFKADGQWQLTPGKNARGVWRPIGDKPSLTYRVTISHGRKSGSFDTRMTLPGAAAW